ncbi:MAG: nucleotidyl transferase AbiEii/AbiGii toxin family protein [Cyanobacteria bacterium P01_D01_bin.36]
MTFQHPIHNKVLQVLETINRNFFEDCSIAFGGGTMLALAYEEYRLSRDIDFLCPYGEAFSRLRTSIFDNGYEALFNLDECNNNNIVFPRDLRTDRDGIRFAVQNGDTIFKFEIVAEGRISLEPALQLEWSPVPCLSLVDQVTEKLLANGDRWADRSVDSRDLIDLAMLKLKTSFPEQALDKAESAYPTIEPLKRSIRAFQAAPDYRARCYDRLQIENPAAIVDGLDLLATQFGLPSFERMALEQ